MKHMQRVHPSGRWLSRGSTTWHDRSGCNWSGPQSAERQQTLLSACSAPRIEYGQRPFGLGVRFQTSRQALFQRQTSHVGTTLRLLHGIAFRALFCSSTFGAKVAKRNSLTELSPSGETSMKIPLRCLQALLPSRLLLFLLFQLRLELLENCQALSQNAVFILLLGLDLTKFLASWSSCQQIAPELGLLSDVLKHYPVSNQGKFRRNFLSTGAN